MSNTESNTNQHGNCELKDDEIVEDLKKWISMSKYISEPVFVQHILLQRILDLINRKNAEILELRADYNYLFETMPHMKTEAIKEFAERLKAKAFGMEESNGSFKIVDVDDIDNLLKEMESEK